MASGQTDYSYVEEDRNVGRDVVPNAIPSSLQGDPSKAEKLHSAPHMPAMQTGSKCFVMSQAITNKLDSGTYAKGLPYTRNTDRQNKARGMEVETVEVDQGNLPTHGCWYCGNLDACNAKKNVVSESRVWKKTSRNIICNKMMHVRD